MTLLEINSITFALQARVIIGGIDPANLRWQLVMSNLILFDGVWYTLTNFSLKASDWWTFTLTCYKDWRKPKNMSYPDVILIRYFTDTAVNIIWAAKKKTKKKHTRSMYSSRCGNQHTWSKACSQHVFQCFN